MPAIVRSEARAKRKSREPDSSTPPGSRYLLDKPLKALPRQRNIDPIDDRPLPATVKELPMSTLVPGFNRADPLLIGDALPLGIVLIDIHTDQLLHINSEAERLLGLSRAQVLQQPAHQIFPTELAQACSPARWNTLLGTRIPAKQTLALATRYGQRWLKLRMTLVDHPAGQRTHPTGLLTLADASAERQLERALQESDARFREVTEAVRECLFVTTPQWDRLHFSSPLLLDMLGLTALELRQGPQRFRERIHVEDRALYDRRLLTQTEGGGTDVVLRVEHPTKGLRWLRLRTRIQQQSGQPLVYAILADVTEEQQQQQELQIARDKAETASRAKSEFMANMSHEFRTPMNGILGNIELLLGSALGADQRQRLQVTQASAEHLLHLMNDVLDFARINADTNIGASSLDEEDFDPLQLARQAIERVRPRAQAKGLTLQLDAAASLPPLLRGDGRRIGQVLEHLLDNALKFTERGGAILHVASPLAEAGQRLLEFELSDSGIGIDPAELPRLTDPFTQGNASLARPYAGAGLGLAMAQQLITLMGGHLAARRLPQGGSSFSFSLRVGAVSEAAPADAQKLPLQGSYILVVEDNQVNQEVIAQMLTQLGSRVRLAASGPDGLQALQDERFDLVMMDIHMPGMDGMEVLHRFRRAAGGRSAPDVPVIAVTANALSGDAARLLRHGFDDYLPKPFRQSHLLAMLTRHLQHSQESKQNAQESSRPASAGAGEPADAARSPHDGTAMPDNASPDASTTLLDAPSLARLRELDPTGVNKLLERVVAAYLKSLERLLPELAQARGATLDLHVVRHVSHTLKSSSASLGALSLAQRCAEIETMARNGHSDGLESLLDAMLDEVAQVRLALTALLTSTP